MTQTVVRGHTSKVAESGSKWLLVDQNGQERKPEAEIPRGTFDVSVDAKGRLKLPSKFKEYFEAVDEKNFFVTTIDRRLLYVYPLSVWKHNEQVLQSMTGSQEEIESAESIAFIANHFGADAAMDGEGRLLVPQELRKQLGLNDSKVWVGFEKGKIVGYSSHEYQKKLDAAFENIGGKTGVAKVKGLK